MAEVEVKNKFSVGDELELINPGGNRSFRLEEMHDMDGHPTDVAPGSGYRVQIPMEDDECELGLLACNL